MRRKLLGLTLDDLSQSTGYSRQQLHNYEIAASRIGAARLYRLADALGVSVTWFYAGFDD